MPAENSKEGEEETKGGDAVDIVKAGERFWGA